MDMSLEGFETDPIWRRHGKERYAGPWLPARRPRFWKGSIQSLVVHHYKSQRHGICFENAMVKRLPMGRRGTGVKSAPMYHCDKDMFERVSVLGD